MKTVLAQGVSWPVPGAEPKVTRVGDLINKLMFAYLLAQAEPVCGLSLATDTGCSRKTAHGLLHMLRGHGLLRESEFRTKDNTAHTVWWEAV